MGFVIRKSLYWTGKKWSGLFWTGKKWSYFKDNAISYKQKDKAESMAATLRNRLKANDRSEVIRIKDPPRMITATRRGPSSIVGRRFTRLVVRAEDPSRGSNSYCTCECRCGQTCAVKRAHLLAGDTRSCGCLAREQFKKNGTSRRINLVGERFGTLVVLRQWWEPGSKGYADCICDCGRPRDRVWAVGLRDGTVRQCGRKHEEARRRKEK